MSAIAVTTSGLEQANTHLSEKRSSSYGEESKQERVAEEKKECEIHITYGVVYIGTQDPINYLIKSSHHPLPSLPPSLYLSLPPLHLPLLSHCMYSISDPMPEIPPNIETTAGKFAMKTQHGDLLSSHPKATHTH